LPFPLQREPVREQASVSILVVDDSLTTRTLEKSILEAHGYRVRVAVDGVDALEKLHAETADLIIADIQMPRMDGFGLLQALKKDSRLGSIPIIMVTSVERPEDRERGLALGAGAWIVKRKFDQGELLDAIRQIL
jgi:two-component system chemotaxis sensor kinase CheA